MEVYRTILVPLDGSRPAEAALAYANSLAGGTDVRVTLLHVVDKADGDCLPLHEAYVERIADNLERAVAEMRHEPKPRKRRRSQHLTADPKVVVGDPAESILRVAARGDTDLIIMTNDSRSRRRRWLMGSVASKVLHGSEVPVLLVRAGGSRETVYGKWSDTKLVVLLDGSELAEWPCHTLRNWRDNGHPVTSPSSWSKYANHQFCRFLLRHRLPLDGNRLSGNHGRVQTICQDVPGKQAERIRKSGVAVTSQVLEGPAAAEILGYASKGSHTIVVMTTHGRTGLRRWPFGGTAQKVLWGASGPVLLVRPPAMPRVYKDLARGTGKDDWPISHALLAHQENTTAQHDCAGHPRMAKSADHSTGVTGSLCPRTTRAKTRRTPMALSMPPVETSRKPSKSPQDLERSQYSHRRSSTILPHHRPGCEGGRFRSREAAVQLKQASSPPWMSGFPAPELGTGLLGIAGLPSQELRPSNAPADNLEYLEPEDAARRGSQANKDVHSVQYLELEQVAQRVNVDRQTQEGYGPHENGPHGGVGESQGG